METVLVLRRLGGVLDVGVFQVRYLVAGGIEDVCGIGQVSV